MVTRKRSVTSGLRKVPATRARKTVTTGLRSAKGRATTARTIRDMPKTGTARKKPTVRNTRKVGSASAFYTPPAANRLKSTTGTRKAGATTRKRRRTTGGPR